MLRAPLRFLPQAEKHMPECVLLDISQSSSSPVRITFHWPESCLVQQFTPCWRQFLGSQRRGLLSSIQNISKEPFQHEKCWWISLSFVAANHLFSVLLLSLHDRWYSREPSPIDFLQYNLQFRTCFLESLKICSG